MTEKIFSTCNLCKFFHGQNGECRRISPLVSAEYITRWPKVQTTDWCGSFESVPAKRETFSPQARSRPKVKQEIQARIIEDERHRRAYIWQRESDGKWFIRGNGKELYLRGDGKYVVLHNGEVCKYPY